MGPGDSGFRGTRIVWFVRGPGFGVQGLGFGERGLGLEVLVRFRLSGRLRLQQGLRCFRV